MKVKCYGESPSTYPADVKTSREYVISEEETIDICMVVRSGSDYYTFFFYYRARHFEDIDLTSTRC